MGCAALRDGRAWLLGGCIDRFPGDTVMDWYEAETNVIHCADVFEFDSAASRWMQVPVCASYHAVRELYLVVCLHC